MGKSIVSVLFLFGLIYGQTDKGVGLRECEECCTAHFSSIIASDTGDRQAFIKICEENGCFNEDCDNANNDEQEEACLVGLDFRTQGFHEFNLSIANSESINFCVDGDIDISFAPSKSPTKSPRETITFEDSDDEENPEESESEQELPLIPIVLAGVGVAILLLAAILFLLKPKRKFLDEGLTDFDETHTVTTMGTATVINNHMKEKAKFAGKIVKYIVVEDFDAESEDELTVKKGEILEGVTPVDKEWWFVRRIETGEEGMVALSFMQEHEVIHLTEQEKEDNPDDPLPGPGPTKTSVVSPAVADQDPIDI